VTAWRETTWFDEREKGKGKKKLESARYLILLQNDLRDRLGAGKETDVFLHGERPVQGGKNGASRKNPI